MSDTRKNPRELKRREDRAERDEADMLDLFNSKNKSLRNRDHKRPKNFKHSWRREDWE